MVNPQNIDKGETIVNLYAANPDVIAVTASTSTGTIAAYTNFGNEVSVCAPSSNWDPSKGMTKLTAAGIYTTASSDGDQIDGNGAYSDDFGGTSAAAPLVAGIAALVLSANNDLPAAIVKKILEVTADKIDFENSGKEKYDDKGHSQYYGYGKVNAANAVRLATQLRNTNQDGTSMSISGYMQQIEKLVK
jgi:subtilisin family serine protease